MLWTHDAEMGVVQVAAWSSMAIFTLCKFLPSLDQKNFMAACCIPQLCLYACRGVFVKQACFLKGVVSECLHCIMHSCAGFLRLWL